MAGCTPAHPPKPRQPPSRVWFGWLKCGSPARWCAGLPVNGVSGGVLLSHTLPGAVPSALWVLASGFGMGPGVSPTL